MNPANYLKLILYLTTIIGLLDIKWEYPKSGVERVIILQLMEVRRDLHIAYKLQSGLELPTGYTYAGSEIE